ncbi:hypothetical protein LCGC14_2350260, partial [marine sediment metagenome]
AQSAPGAGEPGFDVGERRVDAAVHLDAGPSELRSVYARGIEMRVHIVVVGLLASVLQKQAIFGHRVLDVAQNRAHEEFFRRAAGVAAAFRMGQGDEARDVPVAAQTGSVEAGCGKLRDL